MIVRQSKEMSNVFTAHLVQNFEHWMCNFTENSVTLRKFHVKILIWQPPSQTRLGRKDHFILPRPVWVGWICISMSDQSWKKRKRCVWLKKRVASLIDQLNRKHVKSWAIEYNYQYYWILGRLAPLLTWK